MRNLSLYTKDSYIPRNLNLTDSDMFLGSGMESKTLYAKEAFPPIHLTPDPAHASHIMLVEPLAMHQSPVNADEVQGGTFDYNLLSLQQNSALKIMWAEEQQLLRWSQKNRDRFFNSMSHLTFCNKYLLGLMQPFIGNRPASILRTPIDADKIKPAKKKGKKIIAMGRICREKNIQGVVDIFEKLSDDFEVVYLGGQDMWGENLTAENTLLEAEIRRVADRWIRQASRQQVIEELASAWGYLNVSIYDVGCLSFLEAAMAGCHCFAWTFHPMFNEYSRVHRFENYDDGVSLIEETWKYKAGTPDYNMRKEVMALHSYKAFNVQLKKLISEAILEDGTATTIGG